MPNTGEPGAGPAEGICTYQDFQKIRLRVAEVIAADFHPNADKLLRLRIRLGERIKQICAGIRGFYEPSQLIGKRIVVVDNLEPRKIRGEISEGMLLAAHESGSGRLALVTVDAPDFASDSPIS
ncbi:MAG: methionine--tRNA ligase subunit beta [Planctomycetota bacterium]|nr:methionine--tRNA ligase subunit beta [Planctomycetota bacterium]